MKKSIILFLILIVITSAFIGCTTSTEQQDQDKSEEFTETIDFGAAGAKNKENLTIEEMLRYAIEDEYLARQEYELIINEFGQQRPFINIIKAEEYHIELLKEIYETYGYDIPEDKSENHVILPKNIEEALNTV